MSIRVAQRLLRSHLLSNFPTTPIAVEGISFEPPDDLYIRVQFVNNNPTDPTLGNYFYRENISMQVFVCERLGVGTDSALQVAEQLRNVFDKGLTLTESQITLHILSTPKVSSSVITTDRLVVPVLISVTVEVYRN